MSDLSYLSDLDNECQSYNYDLSNGSPIDTNNFTIVHYNINSITAPGRLDQLSDICSILKLDILILTETKLDNTISNNSITIPAAFLDTANNILQKLSNYNVTQKVIASDLNFGNCYCKFPVLEPKPLDAAASDLSPVLVLPNSLIFQPE